MQTVAENEQEKAKNAEEQAAANKTVENDIYTMPKEFYVQPKKESHLGRNIAIIVLVLVVVFGGATAYVLLTREAPAGEEVPITPELLLGDEDTDDGINPVAPVIDDTTVIDQTPDTPDTPSDTPPTDDETVVAPEPPPTALRSSVDLDGDGLTDIEETLLGIDPAVPDTDEDGFFDGAELLAGYDPSRPEAQLAGSGIFASYVNEDPVFSIQVPSAWSQQRDPGEQDSISFVAINNDSIRFTVVGNSDNLAIEQWHRATYPERTLNELTNRTVGGRIGRESIVRREVYVPLEGTVLIIQYDVAGKQEIAYPAIFEYILDSVTL